MTTGLDLVFLIAFFMYLKSGNEEIIVVEDTRKTQVEEVDGHYGYRRFYIY
jgi:hypothetical protein